MFPINEYLKYFYDVRSCKHLKEPCRILLTHIPVHPMEFKPIGRWNYNIHGHKHTLKVLDHTNTIPDSRYICVSLEQTNFHPVSFNQLFEMIKLRDLEEGNDVI
jgi:calcineurin-like phosphoesterase family protein